MLGLLSAPFLLGGGRGAAKILLPCFLVPKGDQPTACTLALWWLKFGLTRVCGWGGVGFHTMFLLALVPVFLYLAALCMVVFVCVVRPFGALPRILDILARHTIFSPWFVVIPYSESGRKLCGWGGVGVSYPVSP